MLYCDAKPYNKHYTFVSYLHILQKHIKHLLCMFASVYLLQVLSFIYERFHLMFLAVPARVWTPTIIHNNIHIAYANVSKTSLVFLSFFMWENVNVVLCFLSPYCDSKLHSILYTSNDNNMKNNHALIIMLFKQSTYNEMMHMRWKSLQGVWALSLSHLHYIAWQ